MLLFIYLLYIKLIIIVHGYNYIEEFVGNPIMISTKYDIESTTLLYSTTYNSNDKKVVDSSLWTFNNDPQPAVGFYNNNLDTNAARSALRSANNNNMKTWTKLKSNINDTGCYTITLINNDGYLIRCIKIIGVKLYSLSSINNEYIYVGKNITLICNTSSISLSKQWYFTPSITNISTPLFINSIKKNNQLETITIQNVNNKNTGYYSCVSIYPNNERYVSTIFVNVRGNNIYTQLGSNITIKCEDKNTFTGWIIQKKNHYECYRTKSTSFHIRNVTTNDIGYYWCNINNFDNVVLVDVIKNTNIRLNYLINCTTTSLYNYNNVKYIIYSIILQILYYYNKILT